MVRSTERFVLIDQLHGRQARMTQDLYKKQPTASARVFVHAKLTILQIFTRTQRLHNFTKPQIPTSAPRKCLARPVDAPAQPAATVALSASVRLAEYVSCLDTGIIVWLT